CYMKITKKNIGMILVYFVIFAVISAVMFYVNSGDNGNSKFTSSKLAAGIVDNDKSGVSEKLAEYLSKLHDVDMLEYDIDVLQEKMYYNKYDIIVQIPEGFSEKFLSGDARVSVTQQPGSYSYMYVENQINDFINRIIKYNIAGYTMEESFERVQDVKESKVTLIDVNGNGGEMPDFAFLFQFFPYTSIAILGNVLGLIVYSFRKREVKNRIAASAVSLRRQSAEAFLAFIVIGVIIWAAFLALVFVMKGKELLNNANMFYYILNSFTVMALSLSIAFFTGILAKKPDMVNMIVTPISLFMSFLGGVFVPLNILNGTVRKAAKFIPVYWYEDVNNKLSEYAEIPADVIKEIWGGIGIQVLYILMFIALTLAVSRYQVQER
ncbi:MAG: ABC transporter permease, partial [Lachnospiraceae bacterium]|nr:ABC transporter permease [Lachnospiraceae bacterium]